MLARGPDFRLLSGVSSALSVSLVGSVEGPFGSIGTVGVVVASLALRFGEAAVVGLLVPWDGFGVPVRFGVLSLGFGTAGRVRCLPVHPSPNRSFAGHRPCEPVQGAWDGWTG